MHQAPRRFWLGALLALTAAGCSARLPASDPVPPGDYCEELESPEAFAGRQVRVHLPPQYDGRTPLPLVVALHGAYSSASGFQGVSGFDAVADAEGFVVAYPEATGNGLGMARIWNSGHVHARAWEEKVDDVGFLTECIEALCRRLQIDRERVYVAGFSSGGMMALRLAADRPGLFAAVASVAGTVGGRPNDRAEVWTPPVPADRLPALFVHGRDDRRIPYGGGEPDRRVNGFTCLSHQESAEWWARALGLPFPPVLGRSFGVKVWRQAWGEGQEVVALTIEGWEHVWPGPATTRSLPDDDPLRAFDAARVCWEFFRDRRSAPRPK